MREFQANGRTISAYLAVPEQGSGPGVLVLHAWWGLTDVFKQADAALYEAKRHGRDQVRLSEPGHVSAEPVFA